MVGKCQWLGKEWKLLFKKFFVSGTLRSFWLFCLQAFVINTFLILHNLKILQQGFIKMPAKKKIICNDLNADLECPYCHFCVLRNAEAGWGRKKRCSSPSISALSRKKGDFWSHKGLAFFWAVVIGLSQSVDDLRWQNMLPWLHHFSIYHSNILLLPLDSWGQLTNAVIFRAPAHAPHDTLEAKGTRGVSMR